MHDGADIDKHSLVEVGDRAVSDTLGNYLAVANDHVVQLALKVLHRFLELASDLVGLLNVAVERGPYPSPSAPSCQGTDP